MIDLQQRLLESLEVGDDDVVADIAEQMLQPPRPVEKPVIIPDLDPERYHNDLDSVSASGLRDLARTPLHHYYLHRRPDREAPEPTPSQKLGTAVHMAVLEPRRFEVLYLPAPNVDRRTKDGKADYAAYLERLGDGIEISANDHATALRIAESVRKHPVGKKLLCGAGMREVSVYWTDRETGVRCRMRPDFAPATESVLVDLKSTGDASDRAFSRTAWNYGYQLTAAFYKDGWKAATGEDRDYVFAAWEKDEPHACAWYYAEDDMIEAGRAEYKRLLRIYADCLASGVWPGYPNQLQPLYLPSWAESR